MRKFRSQSFRHAMAMMAVGMAAGMSTSSAHAYLDPGTGSIILQLLLGGMAGLALAVRLYWHRFLSLIGLRRQVAESDRLVDERSVGLDERGRQQR
jgi:hypothetical protein